MKEKILEILRRYATNEENQAGVKGDVIWECEFELIARKLVKFFGKPNKRNANATAYNDGYGRGYEDGMIDSNNKSN